MIDNYFIPGIYQQPDRDIWNILLLKGTLKVAGPSYGLVICKKCGTLQKFWSQISM